MISTVILDANQLFTNNEDKQLLIEYYKFVAYILDYTTNWVVESSSMRFSEYSILYRRKDDFIQMLQQTFPTFEITFDMPGNDDYLEHDEYSITVRWPTIKNK